MKGTADGLGEEEVVVVVLVGKECPVAPAFYVVANPEGKLPKLGGIRTPLVVSRICWVH